MNGLSSERMTAIHPRIHAYARQTRPSIAAIVGAWPEPARQKPKIHSHRRIHMNNTIARYLALPILSAGIVGAALGLAGTASAAESSSQHGSSAVATPQTHAQPAAEAVPGYRWHRHHVTLLDPRTAASFPSSMG
jgi:hypothetical protein